MSNTRKPRKFILRQPIKGERERMDRDFGSLHEYLSPHADVYKILKDNISPFTEAVIKLTDKFNVDEEISESDISEVLDIGISEWDEGLPEVIEDLMGQDYLELDLTPIEALHLEIQRGGLMLWLIQADTAYQDSTLFDIIEDLNNSPTNHHSIMNKEEHEEHTEHLEFFVFMAKNMEGLRMMARYESKHGLGNYKNASQNSGGRR